MFLADAINIDEIFGLTSFEREEALTSESVSTELNSISAENLLKSLSFSSNVTKSHKSKLELFDEDGPSLEPAYASHDEIALMIRETDSFFVPISPDSKVSFYSLGKLQI